MGSNSRYKRHVGSHHGMYGTPTYKSWANMKDRCGKKGYEKNITYCKEWEDFRNFYRDMGERPEGTSLDRIDPYGNYCKENCRWVDYITQENNRTNNHFFYYKGEKMTLAQLARKYEISRSNLANKVHCLKMSINDAMDYLISKKYAQGGR